MRRSPLFAALLSLVCCLALLPTFVHSAVADRADDGATVLVTTDDDSAGRDNHRCRIRVLQNDGEDDTVEIDLSGIGPAIAAAMKGMSRALADLDTVRVVSERGGKRLIIREDDHEAVIDVDAIMNEVNEALALAFTEVGDHKRAIRREAREERLHRSQERALRHARAESIREEAVDMREVKAEREDAREATRESLRTEIDSLRAELATLRAELARQRAGRGR